MSGTVRVGAIQSNRVSSCEGLNMDPYRDDFSMDDLLVSIDRRIAWYEDLFRQASQEQCRLAVITEDFTRLSGCMTYLDDRSIFQTAVDEQTPLIAERLCAAAKQNDLHIVACYFAREGDAIFNVADLFGPKGDLVGRYRKVHLPQYELWQVTAGDAFPAFETEIGWVGMLICYDQMWAEASSCCALNGAQVICQPSAAVLADYRMRTRAMDNQIHVISATGRHSMIASPRAEILADGGDSDPGILWADVDIRGGSTGDELYWETIYSGIQDHKERHLKFRHPEAYEVLTQARPPLADQYPEGGVANTPEAIEDVYQKHKAARQKGLRGEPVPYHWVW